MLTPFQQSQNYMCQPKGIIPNGTATLPQIGPISMQFNQSAYPQCHTGRLGLSRNSYFLSLLPHSSPYFVIENKGAKKFKLRVGGSITSQYTHFKAVNSSKWMAEFSNLGFNGISMGKQNVTFTSTKEQIRIPNNTFNAIKHELINNFLCISKKGVIYCPCTLGISSSFPSFLLESPNSTFMIKPTEYLSQMDEICKAKLVPTLSSSWSVHILMIHSVNMMFNYKTGQVSIANQNKIVQPDVQNVEYSQ